MTDSIELRKQIIEAGRVAVEELIKVAKEKIILGENSLADPLAADRLKNAAMAKKLAINDAFEILQKIDTEEAQIKLGEDGGNKSGGFAERRSSKTV